jgi:hypothetical protein
MMKIMQSIKQGRILHFIRLQFLLLHSAASEASATVSLDKKGEGE